MKRFFKRFSTRQKLAMGAALAVALVAVPAVVFAGFGPDRETKVYNGPGTPGFDHVTFDSFTNVPGIGDERNFFTGSYPGGTATTDPMGQVKDGDELTLQILVHNDADPSLNDAPGAPGVAQNTNVRVALPSGIASSQEATAYISASNAQPQTIFDTLDFGAQNGGLFGLTYEPGTASVHGNYINQPISDSVVTSGAPIGTNALDGNVKGCFQQEVFVTLKVKVSMPRYTIQKQVRAKGQTATDWQESLSSKPGDDVQWSIKFDNIGTTELKNVAVVDNVPAGLTVVPGSIVLYNGNYPNGYTFPDSAIQANGSQVNLDIGDYNPLAASDQAKGEVSAQVIFDTKVDQPTGDQCGTETLVNKAFATPAGLGSIFDVAQTVVNEGNECQTPTAVCTALDVEKTGDGRTISAKVTPTTTGDAHVNNFVFNFGDGTTPLVTTDNPVTHTYQNDGTFNVTVKINFTVAGKAVNGVTSESCAKTVTFTPNTPVTPVTPTTPSTPSELVNTGPGDVAAIFTAATAAGAMAYRVFMTRRFGRQ